MAVLKIRQFGDPVLRQKSAAISRIDQKLKDLVKDMADTMYNVEGLGLAAVQVGILLQVIVTDVSGEGKDLRALINPQIIESHGEQVEEEGCLSVAGIKIPVKRAITVKVKGTDLKSGKEVVIVAEDWFSRALQHEIDHLQGTLIIDRAGKEDRTRILRELTIGHLGG